MFFFTPSKAPVPAPLNSSDAVLSGRLPRKDDSHFIILPLVYPLVVTCGSRDIILARGFLLMEQGGFP